MKTVRPANGYIRDAIDTTGPRVGDYSLRAHADDTPAPACTCGKPKRKQDAAPRRTLLESEKRASDEMRARVARQYLDVPGGDS